MQIRYRIQQTLRLGFCLVWLRVWRTTSLEESTRKNTAFESGVRRGVPESKVDEDEDRVSLKLQPSIQYLRST